MLVLILDIKVLGLALSMMRGNQISYLHRQIILVCLFQAFGHMTDNDLSTLYIAQLVVRVNASRLVFRKIDRILYLTYIMVKSTCAHQLRIGIEFPRYLSGQITHLDAMLESAWCHFTHTPQQLLVHVTKLNKRYVGDEAEELLYQIKHRVTTEDCDARDSQVHIFTAIKPRDVIMSDKIYRKVRQYSHHAQAEYCRQSCSHLHRHKLQGALQYRGTDQHHRKMCHYGRPRVHEHPDKNGYHRKWQDIDMQKTMPHHQRGQYRCNDDQRERHADIAYLLEELFPVECQINSEECDNE